MIAHVQRSWFELLRQYTVALHESYSSQCLYITLVLLCVRRKIRWKWIANIEIERLIVVTNNAWIINAFNTIDAISFTYRSNIISANVFISLCLLLVELNIDCQCNVVNTRLYECKILYENEQTNALNLESLLHIFTIYTVRTVYLRTNETERIFQNHNFETSKRSNRFASTCLASSFSVSIEHSKRPSRSFTMCEIIAIRSIRRRWKTVARNGLRSGRNRGGRKREGAAL